MGHSSKLEGSMPFLFFTRGSDGLPETLTVEDRSPGTGCICVSRVCQLSSIGRYRLVP